MTPPLVIKFGADIDSTGLICGMIERGMRADAVIFADTGGEKACTYDNVRRVDALIQAHGWDPIVTVRYTTAAGEVVTLEQHSLATKRMPSVSYGRKSCSVRFKHEPSDKWLRAWEPAASTWRGGGKVRMVIGYNISERKRWMKAPAEDDRFLFEYLLVQWKWGRDECLAAAQRFGLNPKKSACFFCGSARPPEVTALYEDEPDYFWRGVAMEDNARPFFGSIRGLGKNFSWRILGEWLTNQTKLPFVFGSPDEPDEFPCECHEGGADDDE